jgi:hypothetical protein
MLNKVLEKNMEENQERGRVWQFLGGKCSVEPYGGGTGLQCFRQKNHHSIPIHVLTHHFISLAAL